MTTHWHDRCLAVNLWFMIAFQGLYSIGVHKSRNGLGPAYLTSWLSPEATVSQLQSGEWLICSSLSSLFFWQMSLSKGPSATAFVLKYCVDLQKMLKSSIVWRRSSGMAEHSEFFHANAIFFCVLVSERIFQLLHLISACPLPSFGETGGAYMCNYCCSGVLIYTGPRTRFWTCSDPGMPPLEIWSQIQGVCEISKEAVSKLQRVFTFLIGVKWG